MKVNFSRSAKRFTNKFRFVASEPDQDGYFPVSREFWSWSIEYGKKLTVLSTFCDLLKDSRSGLSDCIKSWMLENYDSVTGAWSLVADVSLA